MPAGLLVPQSLRAVLVVHASLLRIRQRLVRFGDLREVFGRSALIGVMLQRLNAIVLLQRAFVRVAIDAEQFIVVIRRRHDEARADDEREGNQRDEARERGTTPARPRGMMFRTRHRARADDRTRADAARARV